MTLTPNTPPTPADRDAERARLAAYWVAREAAALPNACPACGAREGEPCQPASLTEPHLARERAYGDHLRSITPDYPETWDGGRLRRAMRDQSGKANPYLLGGIVTLGLAANGVPMLGVLGIALAIIALAVIIAGGAAVISHLTR